MLSAAQVFRSASTELRNIHAMNCMHTPVLHDVKFTGGEAKGDKQNSGIKGSIAPKSRSIFYPLW